MIVDEKKIRNRVSSGRSGRRFVGFMILGAFAVGAAALLYTLLSEGKKAIKRVSEEASPSLGAENVQVIIKPKK